MANVAGTSNQGSVVARPRKQPQDRKPKAVAATVDGPETAFAFTDANGVTYTSTRLLSEVMTPGVLRRNRSDEFALYCELIEALFAGASDALAAIDGSWEVMSAAVKALQGHMESAASTVGASLGESSGSST